MNRRGFGFGFVMVTVMVVIALAGISAASLLYRMNAEVYASAATQRADHAAAAAYSGLHRAMAVLEQHRAEPEVWINNPDLFQEQLVYDDGSEQWYFTIWSQSDADDAYAGLNFEDSDRRYGLTDAASRISLNFADEQTLLALPGMTPELVEALLDYRDGDDNARPQGAEQAYYSQLDQPYTIKNGPFSSVEELLLVRGFTGAMLLGNPAAQTAELATEPPLIELLTLGSREPDRDAAGAERFNLNGNLDALDDLNLSESAARFIRLYRGEGEQFNHPSDLLGMRHQLRRDVEGDESARAGDWIEAQLTAEDLATLLDRATTSGSPRSTSLRGRVNVNTASMDVLAAVRGVGPDLADQIISARAGLEPQTRGNIAWIYNDGLVDEEKFREIAPRLTAQGYQFNVRVLGYGVPSERFRVYEALVDVAGDRPQMVYVRDITRLGVPMPIEQEF